MMPPMTLSIDLYWSFRSPYSYLATRRLVEINADYDVDINVRPVQPLAVRDDTFFERVDPLFIRYLVPDTFRLAEMMGIDYRWPRPDPIVQDIETGKVATEQPHIWRLTRLGVAAGAEGKGLSFIDQISQVIWDGSVEDWNEGDHLKKAAARAGVDLDILEAGIADDTAKYDALIADNHAALQAAGHWGVPTMVFDGEPFFGQDRIDVLLWRMGQHGLKKR
jgi:2-hydroxychromene-2-carboxylate isomerase